VDVKDDFFDPASITVAMGATVTWTWRGGGTHNVTFEDGLGSSGNQSSGIHERTFATTGTRRYRCTNHSSSFTSGMTGSVVVQ
jgi:plastocyanin